MPAEKHCEKARQLFAEAHSYPQQVPPHGRHPYRTELLRKARQEYRICMELRRKRGRT